MTTTQNPSSFFAQLQPASWRGVPFKTFGGSAKFGRRTAVHEYPFKDTAWVEDLGRGLRRYSISGFVVGDDAIAQRDALIAACEKPGPGELVHPTFGRLTVKLLDFSTNEHWERGRVFEFEATFVEDTAARQFPGTAVASADAINAAAAEVQSKSTQQWLDEINAQFAANAPVQPTVAAVSTDWLSRSKSAVASATNLVSIATQASGNFGRMVGQATGIVIGAIQTVSKPVSALYGAAAAARLSVDVSARAVSSAAANLTATTSALFTLAVTGHVAAVKAASFSPASAIATAIAMTKLAAATSLTSASTADYLRRLAVTQLCTASGDYQPSTALEATAVRDEVLSYVDSEIKVAGEQGNDAVYAALRAARAEVIRDMNAKGARLPSLVTVATPSSVPSLVLAQRLYQDIGREPELVRRADCPNPAFMPTTFSALSS
jgi:prophage DNA circulation protein